MKQYKYRIEGEDFDVNIKSLKGQVAEVVVNGIPFNVQMLSAQLTEDELPEMVAQEIAAPVATTTEVKEETAAPSGAGEGKAITAPLPGVVTKVMVQVGQQVKKGEAVIILEAMKMENNIVADNDGTVTGVAVKQGDSVMEGATLITIKD